MFVRASPSATYTPLTIGNVAKQSNPSPTSSSLRVVSSLTILAGLTVFVVSIGYFVSTNQTYLGSRAAPNSESRETRKISPQEAQKIVFEAAEKLNIAIPKSEVENSYIKNMQNGYSASAAASRAAERESISNSTEKSKTAQHIDTAVASRETELKNSIMYELMRDKIIESVVSSYTVEVVGYWLPQDSYFSKSRPSVANLPQMRQDGRFALQDITKLFAESRSSQYIAQKLLIDYPSLGNALSVNGQKLKSPTKTLTTPENLVIEQANISRLIPKDQVQKFTAMKEGDVAEFTYGKDYNMGAFVVKMIRVNKSQHNTFNDWLNAQIK